MTSHELPERLLLATGNQGKLDELQQLFKELPFKLLGLEDIPEIAEPAEEGETFDENAAAKAAYYARHSGLWTVADDSGLEVAALGGKPGVRSARYGGEGTDYSIKIERLLLELLQTGESDRSARFVCCMAVGLPNSEVLAKSRGSVIGRIAFAPRGKNGFGYDPIFVPDGFERTFAELDTAEKQQISHRKRAADEIIRFFLDFTGV